MDNLHSSSPSSEDILDMIRVLREDMARHEKLLGKVMEHLHLNSEQLSAGWMPSKGDEGIATSAQAL